MIKVCKFGGSSLSCQEQFLKVKDIINSDSERQLIVVSAIGKRNNTDSKITDLLYILHAHLIYSVPYQEIWQTISTRFLEIKNFLNLDYDIESDLKIIYNQLNKSISQDYLVSRGEYLTAKLISNYLGFKFVDASSFITFNYKGSIDYQLTQNKYDKIIQPAEKIVVPGFYGVNQDDSIRLLSRGGSDITGSILARCAKASVYENWTDVSGVLVADPRLVKNPHTIKEITYTELRELSYMGANVLHEDTIFPVQDLNIPINIKNTNDPKHPGTIITSLCSDYSQVITGIAGKDGFLSIEVYRPLMSNQIGFFKNLLAIFEKYHISVEHAPTGIDAISVIVNKNSISKCLYDIITDIKKELNAQTKIFDDLALITVVGRNMVDKSGISGKLFSVLGEKNISVKMITQSSQELNIIIGVKSSDYKDAIKALYSNLIN